MASLVAKTQKHTDYNPFPIRTQDFKKGKWHTLAGGLCGNSQYQDGTMCIDIVATSDVTWPNSPIITNCSRMNSEIQLTQFYFSRWVFFRASKLFCCWSSPQIYNSIAMISRNVHIDDSMREGNNISYGDMTRSIMLSPPSLELSMRWIAALFHTDLNVQHVCALVNEIFDDVNDFHG